MSINQIVFGIYTVTCVCALLLIKGHLAPALASLRTTPDMTHLGFAALGAFLYVASFLMWMFVLTKFDLSVAYPISVGLTLAFTAIGAAVVFGEHLTLIKMVGFVLILAGVIAVSKG